MAKDLGFLLAFVIGVASAIAAAGAVLHGHWIEASACSAAFIACIVIALRLAMSALIDRT